MFPVQIESSSPEETIEAGKKAAAFLEKGSVVAFMGTLGAGKTCMIKGIGVGLEVDEEITSPSYTIVSEYAAKLRSETIPLYHIDAYRLNGNDDFIAMGGEEYIYGNGITLIEWSERIAEVLPEETIFIEIKVIGADKRIINISKGKK